ncbi:MAG: 8-oxo-dGDP phosphatase [Actinomycetota bacterium]|jgi:ADP-ribose pyrophosphatase|nr:8-oxo-dGDP phosphatase [Actinomycetota bacterium]
MSDHLRLADEPAQLTVVTRETVYHGSVWDVRRDRVDLGDGQTVTREVVVHTGAVGIIALDDEDRVLLLRQYRHPVRAYLWEPPAGLLDVKGESALDCARRELAEEAHLRADEWHVLVDFYNSPGGSTEAFRCFLARRLHPVPEHERHEGEGEERDMPSTWVPLEEARDLVLAGRLHNPTAVAGILAAVVGRDLGWSRLRAADSPWPQRSAGRWGDG